MSARDDLSRATDEARAQVRAAREALASSRDARTGGVAKDVDQAEQQLAALRDAVAEDLRVLRGRVTGLGDAERRGATIAGIAGAGALATLVGTGLAVRGRVRRVLAQREVQQQARAIASAMARQAADAAADVLAAGTRAGTRAGSRGGRRRGRGALLAALTVGAAVAGAVVVQQRRNAPVDPDDLWLPEREPRDA